MDRSIIGDSSVTDEGECEKARMLTPKVKGQSTAYQKSLYASRPQIELV